MERVRAVSCGSERGLGRGEALVWGLWGAGPGVPAWSTAV